MLPKLSLSFTAVVLLGFVTANVPVTPQKKVVVPLAKIKILTRPSANIVFIDCVPGQGKDPTTGKCTLCSIYQYSGGGSGPCLACPTATTPGSSLCHKAIAIAIVTSQDVSSAVSTIPSSNVLATPVSYFFSLPYSSASPSATTTPSTQISSVSTTDTTSTTTSRTVIPLSSTTTIAAVLSTTTTSTPSTTTSTSSTTVLILITTTTAHKDPTTIYNWQISSTFITSTVTSTSPPLLLAATPSPIPVSHATIGKFDYLIAAPTFNPAGIYYFTCPAGSWVHGDDIFNAKADETYYNNNYCVPCIGGMYTPGRSSKASQCQSCPAGSYSFSGSSSCIACPIGTVALSNSNGDTGTGCFAILSTSSVSSTSTFTNSTTIPTPNSTTIPTSSPTPLPGPVSHDPNVSFTPLTSMTTPADANPSGILCPPGSYFSNNACSACDYGTYNAYSTPWGKQNCTPCPSGSNSYAFRGSSSCTICPNGSSAFNNGEAGTGCFANSVNSSTPLSSTTTSSTSSTITTSWPTVTPTTPPPSPPSYIIWTQTTTTNTIPTPVSHNPSPTFWPLIATPTYNPAGLYSFTCPPGSIVHGDAIWNENVGVDVAVYNYQNDCSACSYGTFSSKWTSKGDVCSPCSSNSYAFKGFSQCIQCPMGSIARSNGENDTGCFPITSTTSLSSTSSTPSISLPSSSSTSTTTVPLTVQTTIVTSTTHKDTTTICYFPTTTSTIPTIPTIPTTFTTSTTSTSTVTSISSIMSSSTSLAYESTRNPSPTFYEQYIMPLPTAGVWYFECPPGSVVHGNNYHDEFNRTNYDYNNFCETCPFGTYSSTNTGKGGTCLPCLNNSYSYNGASVCIQCDANSVAYSKGEYYTGCFNLFNTFRYTPSVISSTTSIPSFSSSSSSISSNSSTTSGSSVTPTSTPAPPPPSYIIWTQTTITNTIPTPVSHNPSPTFYALVATPTYNPAGLYSFTCPPGSIVHADDILNVNSGADVAAYDANNYCSACSYGTFSSKWTSKGDVCSLCPWNSYSFKGFSQCMQCPIGSVARSNGENDTGCFPIPSTTSLSSTSSTTSISSPSPSSTSTTTVPLTVQTTIVTSTTHKDTTTICYFPTTTSTIPTTSTTSTTSTTRTSTSTII